jgi:hypothetical protein
MNRTRIAIGISVLVGIGLVAWKADEPKTKPKIPVPLPDREQPAVSVVPAPAQPGVPFDRGRVVFENGKIWLVRDGEKVLLETEPRLAGRKPVVLDAGVVLIPEDAIVTWTGADKLIAVRLGEATTYWADGRVESMRKERKK